MSKAIVDPQAELRLLGIVLREPRLVDDVMTLTTEQSFASDRAKALYDAVRTVYVEDPSKFSRVKVQALLRQSLGGDASVEIIKDALSDSEPSLFDGTLRVVLDLAQRRGVLAALTEAHGMITNLETPMEDVRNTALGKLTDALGAAGAKSMMLAGEMHEAYWQRVRQDRQRGAVSVIPTGIGSLQSAMRGYQAGDVIVVGAATGVGKTHFMLNQALFAAAKGNITALFSLEMTWEKLYRRLLRTEVGPYQEHRLTEAEIEHLEAISANTIAGLPLIVVDKHGLTGQEIASMCRVIAARNGGLDFVAVDYIQRCGDPAGGYREKRHAVAANMDAFEQLAADMRIPVMIGSQVGRHVHERADKVPQVSDMMESSSIEHLADVIMLLYRHDYYLDKTDDLYHEIKGIFEIHIPKNRDAEDKEVAYLGSDLSRSKFWDLSQREIEDYADAIERANQASRRR